MMRLRSLFLWLFIGLMFPVHAQRDSIQFSLLTCSPGQEIYSLFGHTAIRYQNYTKGLDLVFNYGMFSFNTPNFILRFVKGETDYQLGVTPYIYFADEYAMRGSTVYQQKLNLTPDENRRLLNLLELNFRPENRVYRYNYFYDNCTTRARDQIEKSIEGKVVYPDSVRGEKTFRSIVHEFTSVSPWGELGIDICLGAEADETIGIRQQMFAPFYMKDYASRAYIINKNGLCRQLVQEESKIIDVDAIQVSTGGALSPMLCSLLLLFVSLFIGWYQWKCQKVYWWWEAFLMVLQGAAGCVIAFLFFFSVHPTVGSNWLLWVFNPLPLFYAPVFIYKAIKCHFDWYPILNLPYLTLFMIIMGLRVQEINLTVLPLTLTLLVASASHLLVLKKSK